MENPNDKVRIVKTPYGNAELPLDFDVRYKTAPVSIKQADGSSIASALFHLGKLVDFKDGPYQPTGKAYISLRVGVVDDNGGLDLEGLIGQQILPGFGPPEIPLDAGV